MDKSSLTAVNPFYLDKVMSLTKNHEIVTHEDIYNAQGMKLIPKGKRIDDDLYERLVRFKLRRPLESSLTVNDGVQTKTILEQAQILLDEVEPLAALLRATHSTRTALSVLKETRLDQVSTLLITMGKGMGTLPHNILASLFGLAIGIGLNLNENMLRSLVLAGLLHDTGELYINGEYLKPGHQLMPEEWKHVAIHPHIGRLVIQEMTECSGCVALAIGEHHERANGFGYPRQLTGDHLSLLGKILLVSEALSGIFTQKDWSLQRVCLAVKFIPGEYPPEMVSLIVSIPREISKSSPSNGTLPGEEELVARMKHLERALCEALSEIENLSATKKIKPSTDAFLKNVQKRLIMLKNAMYDTVFTPCEQVYTEDSGEDNEIMLEVHTVVGEIEWRLREVSRQIMLQSMPLDNGMRNSLDRVAACLN